MHKDGAFNGASATAFSGRLFCRPILPKVRLHLQIDPTQRHTSRRITFITPSRKPIDFIMAQGPANGEATVGSDGPRQKGKATPDTIK